MAVASRRGIDIMTPLGQRPRKRASPLVLAWAGLAACLGALVLLVHLDPGVEDDVGVRLILPRAQAPAGAPSAVAVTPPPPAPEPRVAVTPPPAPVVDPPPAPPALVQAAPSPAAPVPPAPRIVEPPPPAPTPPQRLAAVPVLPPALLTPLARYAQPFERDERRPRIAIIVTDLGLSNAATEAAIQRLPARITLAFSPYSDGLSHWIDLARAAGHEVMLNLPMEPANYPTFDPGPQTLLTSLTPKENLERLDWVLGRVGGYVGVVNQMGSRFTTDAESLKPVLRALHERGLMFLDTRITPRSIAARVATEIGLPRASNDRFIDQEASRAAIDARLGEVEKIARDTGTAVAMAFPFPVTFERLAAWSATLESKGLVLAPVSAIANRQGDR
jgi:polysaccharide deacetylase 2 family uncharacterized protein YibQ